MDFKTVLSIIIKRFNEEDIDYALMGGFALGLLGVSRATVDLDFLLKRRTTREYLDIEALMEYYKLNLDWLIIEEYFGLFNQVEKFEELKKRFGDVK